MYTANKCDILKNHNDYELTISRNDEEIRNDPFGLGNTVKGLASVTHQRNLSDYAEELVVNYARYSCEEYELSLAMIPEDSQHELARLYIEATEREVNECVYGNDFTINSDFTCALLAMLQDDCQETRDHFAHTTIKNILIYYKDSLEDLLDKACENYLHDVNEEDGYYAHRDLEHDEIVWRKF